jgi:hypothetical protein
VSARFVRYPQRSLQLNHILSRIKINIGFAEYNFVICLLRCLLMKLFKFLNCLTYKRWK